MNSPRQSSLSPTRLLYPSNLKRISLLSVSSLSRAKHGRSQVLSTDYETSKQASSVMMSAGSGSVSGLSSASATASTSKSTLCLYHLIFLTFIILTLLFLIITIGASESESEDPSLDSASLLPNQTKPIRVLALTPLLPYSAANLSHNIDQSVVSNRDSSNTDQVPQFPTTTPTNTTAQVVIRNGTNLKIKEENFTANLLSHTEHYEQVVSSQETVALRNNDPESDPTYPNITSPFSNFPDLNDLNPERILARRYNSSRFEADGKGFKSNQVNNETLSDQPPEEPEDWATRLLRTFGFASPQVLNETGGDPRKRNSGSKQRGSRSVCRISEFGCSRGKCVSGDKYCDGVDDCGDGSDEPRFCTPCNRTYYGEWGSTYSLSLSANTISSILQSHQDGKSPLQGSSSSQTGDKTSASVPHFVCQLAFAAAGDNFGDLVQIMFDSVNIGQFSSSMVQGCPTGNLQIFEFNRPITGGQWCGTGVGYSVYFSEMSAIVLTLTLSPSVGSPSQTTNQGLNVTRSRPTNDTQLGFSKWMTRHGDTTVITSSQQQTNDFEFDFKIRYKFIPKSLAVVRFGLVNSPIERGVLVPDTYCSRVLDTCHKIRCKIQSPNYPGLYPRNVTCYYTVRQREVPPSKRVLIQVTQMKPHKVQLRSIPGRQLLPNTGPYTMEQSTNMDAFLAWEDCRGNRDSLIIYDGTSTNDPVLLKLCGGSYIPPITSSGPAILVAFHSTPFGNPLDPKPAAPFPSPLRGFELDIGVVIVDSDSADYNNHHNCTFIFISSLDEEHSGFKAQEYGGNWITAKSGTVSSPRHTIPLNTTCRYEFRGSKHEAIWIYYSAYRRDLIKDSKEYEGNCTTRLRIWDGIDMRNNALLATYCDNELPRLCDHKALQNETRLVRACTANESYISAGSRLIIEQQFMEGTALRPLHYQFNYEFVRRHAGTDGTCNRHYNLAKIKSSRGVIRTSDDVFDFGRGGRTNITCIYTFTLPSYESLHLKILNSSFGDRPCNTLTDFETGRYVCNESAGGEQLWKRPSASVQIYEEIWTNINLTSHENCICGNSTNNPMFFFTFLGRKVHIKFNVENMKSHDSHENFYVYFEYELKSGGCRGDNHYMKTESGMISLESSFSHGLKDKPPTCEHYPWIIEAREGYSLYLRVPGYTMVEPSGIFSGRYLNRTVLNGTSLDYQQGSFISTSFENRMCPTTKNRIFIYDRNNKRTHKICPASNLQQMTKKAGQTVEIYSEDFDQFSSPLYPPLPPKFVIEFIGRELGSYRLQWLEVMSAKMKVALINMEKAKTGRTLSIAGMSGEESFLVRNASTSNVVDPTKKLSEQDVLSTTQHEQRQSIQNEICESFCPELNACISDKLWCDGEVHCPTSLSDEKSCDSFWLTINQLMSPAVYIPVAAAIVSALVCCGLVMLCLFLKRTVLNGRSVKEDGEGIGSLDRRLERMDPHDPVS